MLEVIEVTKKYRNKIAVEELTFSLKEGEVIGLLGSNGAGKSTTIAMIATLLKPDHGDILLDGESIIKNPKRMRERLGYVPQDIALYENLSGLDNLKFWGRSYGLRGDALKAAIETVSGIIRFTNDELRQKVCTYSGGMKRRMNIGVALLHNPKIVVMDEPTVGLDIISRRAIIAAIKEINKRGVSIIYTGHYFEEIEEICSRIIILEQGKLLINDDKETLLHEQMNLEQYYLSIVKEE
ncbi:MAG: ABC transporter ATP-binding protein [bacterium]|nr:ABC transporter ATP-binding protein [bacterium]